MKHYFIICITLLILTISPRLSGQMNPPEKFITLLKGQSYTDTIHSVFTPSAIVTNCSAVPSNTNISRRFQLNINPLNPQYTGSAKVVVQYTEGFPQIKPRYTVYNIQYVSSVINTLPDFVKYNDANTLSVLPLTNDIHSASTLSLTGIANVTGCDAIISGDTVLVSPEQDTNGGFILYSVKDENGVSASGMIYLLREQSPINTNDTIRMSLLNTREQLLFMPWLGFIPENTPIKGNLDVQHELVYRYVPFSGTSGLDVFSLSDGNGGRRTYIVQLINRNENTSSIRDDVFYTPKNTAITFDVLTNDLSNNFPIVYHSNGIVRDTLGVFTYTPPAGFTGVKNFTYTVNYGNYQATGKIAIHIGNYQPQNEIQYAFHTTKNKPVVLTYDVPISNYNFNILNQPEFGTVEVLQDMSLQEDCNSFYSRATVIYTPYDNYYGGDSFDVEYCVNNNPCAVYKIYIDIHDADMDSLCPCKGPDCVWIGDMNGDGRVSVSDILALGRFIGLSGSGRSDVDYSFYHGQHAADWRYIQPNGKNIKHIDSNGDGVLTVSDTLAVSNYFANINTLVPDQVLAIKDYPFNLVPNATELDSGDLLILDIMVGSATKPVLDVFGLAFGVNVNPAMIDSTSLSVQFDKSSWFTYNTPSIQFVKQPKEGMIQAAFTRTSGIVEDEIEGIKPVGGSGNGKIGQIAFIVEDEIEGIRTSDKFITRRIYTTGIEMEDANGERFLLPDTYIDVKINMDKKVSVPSEDKLIIYPNPAGEQVNIHFNGRNTIKGIRVFDQMGNNIYTDLNIQAQSAGINTASYPTGVYMVQIISTEGVITKKLSVKSK